MLVWLDLETTGLDPRRHTVLEAAAIITDDKLEEVTRFQKTVHFQHAATIAGLFAGGVEPDPKYGFTDASAGSDEARRVVGEITPYVLHMHNKNGLWRDCVKGDPLHAVDAWLADLIAKHSPLGMVPLRGATDGTCMLQPVKPELAGSTVSFDRKFLEVYMPQTYTALNYRNVDVSTFTETARRFWPNVHARRPETPEAEKAHRGLADIEASLDLYKFYLGAIGERANAVMP